MTESTADSANRSRLGVILAAGVGFVIYRESITVDKTSDGAVHAAAVSAQA